MKAQFLNNKISSLKLLTVRKVNKMFNLKQKRELEKYIFKPQTFRFTPSAFGRVNTAN